MKSKFFINTFFLIIAQFLFINAIYAQDTDGDGVLDTVETSDVTDLSDPCDYEISHITEPITAGVDCDGDGVIDANEMIDGTDPSDPCDFLLGNITEPVTAIGVDCDGDGVTNGDEMIDGTNPFDPCDYVILSITLPITVIGIDCDGDGVLDVDELADGTNPNDNCDYDISSQTVAPDGVWETIDCDGDGVLDIIEIQNATDPHNPCDYATPDITEPNTAGLDCDGDGVLDATEIANGTDPQDLCDFNLVDQTLVPTTFCNIIMGSIKLDTNNNGCDSLDIPISNILISTFDGTDLHTTFTQANGDYELHIDQGNYTTEIGSSLPSYFLTSPNTHTSNFVGAGNSDIADFCMTTTQTVNDVNINVFPSQTPRPGFNVSYRIIFKNIGTSILNGDVQFQFDGVKMNFLTASETITTQTSNSLTFSYLNLNLFETRIIDIDFVVNAPPIANNGEDLNFIVTVNPVSGDNTPIDNVLNFTQTLIGSYDPNDITVLEGAEIELDEIDNYLHYLIRFQNEGTADAINIVVTNELDTKLDWGTFQLESTSHSSSVNILNGNQVNFIFDEVHLPDSTTDEPGSHGYIAYKIKPKNNIVIGDIVVNQANIYFDFNLPIITNIAITEIVENTVSIDDNYLSKTVSIYPIPSNDIINISSKTKIIKLELFDVLGKLIKVKTTNLDSINVSSLENNIYFLKLKDEFGNIGMKKIVIK